MRGSHGLSARRARRTKSRGPKGLRLEVRARRAPRLLSIKINLSTHMPISIPHPVHLSSCCHNSISAKSRDADADVNVNLECSISHLGQMSRSGPLPPPPPPLLLPPRPHQHCHQPHSRLSSPLAGHRCSHIYQSIKM